MMTLVSIMIYLLFIISILMYIMTLMTVNKNMGKRSMVYTLMGNVIIFLIVISASWGSIDIIFGDTVFSNKNLFILLFTTVHFPLMLVQLVLSQLMTYKPVGRTNNFRSLEQI